MIARDELADTPILPWTSRLCHPSFRERMVTFQCCVRGRLPRPIVKWICGLAFEECKDGFRAALVSSWLLWYPKTQYPYTQEATIASLVRRDCLMHIHVYERLVGEECRAWYTIPNRPPKLCLWNERTRRGSDRWSRDAIAPEDLDDLQRYATNTRLLLSPNPFVGFSLGIH